MQLYTQHKRLIEIENAPFAKGGQGAIHAIKSPVSTPAQVAKLYLSNAKAKEVEKRIVYMVNNNPFLNAQQMIADSFAWPLELLYNSVGEFVGFTMRLIENSKPLWNLTLAKGFKDKNWDKFNIVHHDSYNKRLKVLYNVCQALDVLDKSNLYRVVDLKPQNMMLTNTAHIRIIDCDSFQIAKNKNVLFNAEAATDEYCPPEFQKGKINFRKQYVESSWDYFAFAVTAYQVLFCIHPFIGSHPKFQTQSELIQNGLFVHGRKKQEFIKLPPPHQNFNLLIGNNIKDLFMDALDEGYYSTNKRPSFSQWRDELLNEINRVNANPGSIGKFQPVAKSTKKKAKKKNKQSIPKQNNHVPAFGAILQQFSIQTGKYTASISWNVSYSKSVALNGKMVPLNGTQIIPLENKIYNLTITDQNGQTKTFHKTLNAPAFVDLMPVKSINARQIKILNSSASITGSTKITSAITVLNTRVMSLGNKFQNQLKTQKIYKPANANINIKSVSKPVTLIEPTKKQKQKDNSKSLLSWLNKAAAFIL